MVGSMSIVDILFLVTVILLVFSGFRNGAVISLFSLLSIPIGFFVASHYGPGFTAMLAASGLSATPLISYVVLFFGTALVLHILGSSVRNITKGIPLLGPADTLLGGAIGFGYWVVLGLTNSLGQSGVLPAALAAWGANGVYAVLGVVLFLGAE